VSDNTADIVTVNYYNSGGELIQVLKREISNTVSVLALGYDFKGQMTRSFLQAASLSVTKLYAYDVFGRVASIRHSINNAPPRLIATYSYDNLGRMDHRYLGSMRYDVAYEYNIRNWITGINKDYCLDKTPGSYFGMELCYDKGYNTTYKNGRLAGIRWRNFGTENELRTYGYHYDFASRLTLADYYETLGTMANASWTKSIKDFTTSNMQYDAGGNLLSMKHKGLSPAKTTIVLDDLTYHYTTGTNILQSVDESVASQSRSNTVHDRLADFRDVPGTTDYQYDGNGNLASDANRGISSIDNSWFNINKPLHVQYTAQGQAIHFVYDANGNLLRKVVTQVAANGVLTVNYYDYLQDVAYRNGVPLLVFHDEGRVRLDKNAVPAYDYFLRDHLGNVRTIITEDAVNSLVINPADNGSSNVNNGSGTGTTGSTGDGSGSSLYGSNEQELPPPDTTQYDPTVYIATSEVVNDSIENELFDNITDTRSKKPLSTDPTDQKSALLDPSSGNPVGPGIMLKVMAGDMIQLGAESFYVNASTTGEQFPLQSLVTSVLGGLSGAAVGVVDGAAGATGSMVNTTDLVNVLSGIQDPGDDTTSPRAYLNYLMFDDALNLVPEASGAIQVSAASGWTPMSVSAFPVPVNGYMYVFSSNSGTSSLRIDNTYLMHWQGRLLEEFHYYPYGLCYDVMTAAGMPRGNVKYNSQFLEQDEFTDAAGNPYGLDWYDFAARSYDPQIGRWLQSDPLMQHPSPYLAMADNPTIFTDPYGLEDGPGPLGEVWDNFKWWLKHGSWGRVKASSGESVSPSPPDVQDNGNFDDTWSTLNKMYLSNTMVSVPPPREFEFQGGMYPGLTSYSEYQQHFSYPFNYETRWIEVAKTALGITECAGQKYEPAIIAFHATTGKFQSDETPWCSSFVNWAITESGITGTNSARAYSWKRWGQRLRSPAYGAIAIANFSHVGFVVGKNTAGKIVVLGGNQGAPGSVSLTVINPNVLHYVYPRGFCPSYFLPVLDLNGASMNYYTTH
jgi:uncharacterized protein (TIGR02594 family)